MAPTGPASANWMREWQATLEQGGYKVGVANPALFHRSDGSRGGVHGDDFAVVGPRRAWDRMGKTLSCKYSMRESHRLGFGSHCERHAELLNRIVSVGTARHQTCGTSAQRLGTGRKQGETIDDARFSRSIRTWGNQ